jgi:ATP-dependent DNA helicase HFM1/MER3
MKMAKVYKASTAMLSVHCNPLTQHAPQFGEAFRPTRLERFVVGYNSSGNDFAFAARLRTELYGVLLQHAKNKPVLIFAATRKGMSVSS